MRLVVAPLLLAASLSAQHGSTTKSNPFSTPADRQEGARLFRVQCAACHGPAGVGGAGGPDLTTGAFRHGDTDAALFDVVAKGIPGSAMPAFGGTGREVWQVVGFVRSLSVGRAAERAKGDPARGALVFRTSNCRNCHAVAGEGGVLGPDLTGIGGVRSLGSLQQSVLDPDQDVSPDYWRLQARTKAGQPISGVRLNEDTHSYQFRDRAGLRSVRKQDLAEHRLVRASPMPAYRGKLAAGDFDDLVAYLASLREAQP